MSLAKHLDRRKRRPINRMAQRVATETIITATRRGLSQCQRVTSDSINNKPKKSPVIRSQISEFRDCRASLITTIKIYYLCVSVSQFARCPCWTGQTTRCQLEVEPRGVLICSDSISPLNLPSFHFIRGGGVTKQQPPYQPEPGSPACECSPPGSHHQHSHTVAFDSHTRRERN